MSSVKSRRKELVGRVVSDKMDKTVVVLVSGRKKHKIYQKFVKVAKRYKAHDEENKYKVGDTVRIIESRPISKDKKWKVIK